MKRLAMAVALLLFAGCGGTTAGDGNPPTVHQLSSGTGHVPANQTLAVGPWSLPTGATVDFTIVDTPTGVGPDTMDIGIVTAASAQTSSPQGYGVQRNVSSTTGTTPALPAGGYDLLVQCFNIVDDCIFDATVNATY
jgi:hypothetical protein